MGKGVKASLCIEQSGIQIFVSFFSFTFFIRFTQFNSSPFKHLHRSSHVKIWYIHFVFHNCMSKLNTTAVHKMVPWGDPRTDKTQFSKCKMAMLISFTFPFARSSRSIDQWSKRERFLSDCAEAYADLNVRFTRM